jgi:hypothetical protein
MSGEHQKRQGRWMVVTYILIALLVGIGGWFTFVVFLAIGLSRPWPGDLRPEDYDPNPQPVDLAAIDFSLRFLNASSEGHMNSVFSPVLVSEGLHIVYKASRGKTATQIDRLLVDPVTFGGVEGRHVYYKAVPLESVVPGVDWIESHSNIFGFERTFSLPPGRDVKLDKWFRWSDATALAFERGESWQGVDAAWLERSFTDQTRAGVTRLSIADDGASLMDLETILYSSSLWSWQGTHKRNLSAGPDLAPFHVNDITTMVPTVCTLNWDWSGALVNQDRTATVVRWNIWSAGGQQFWIVTDLHPSADESTAPLFSARDMEHWLYIEKVGSSMMPGPNSTQWHRVHHVHFPRFTVSSEIDLKKICQAMGAGRAFDPKFSDSVEFAGEHAYVDQFYSALTISVDENGIGGGPASTAPVTNVLTCESPELVVDRPFVFMQTDFHELLLLGRIESPAEY